MKEGIEVGEIDITTGGNYEQVWDEFFVLLHQGIGLRLSRIGRDLRFPGCN